MARLRTNFQAGTLALPGLSSSGTTITFGVVPGFSTISGSDYYAISLDPDTTSEEIVYLTAYTAGQDTGTITRGEEGTTGVSHLPGAVWVHAPTAADYAPVIITEAAGNWVNSVACPGIVGDGSTDDATAIQDVLDAINESNYDTEVVVQSPIVGGAIYINQTVQINTSNTTLRFATPVIFGASGRVRIYGEYAYTPTSNPPTLVDAASAGATSIVVTDGSFFPVNSYIKVVGDRLPGGSALWEDYATVTSNTSGGGGTATLGLSQALEYSYDVTYADGDHSDVVLITSSLATVTPNRGDLTITVASTSSFAVGDYVQILDDELNISSSNVSQPQNYIHREIAMVVSIVSGTVLQLSHALHHNYSLTYNARVAACNMLSNSRIQNAYVTWNAMSTIENAFEIHQGVSCSMENLTCVGGTYSWLNQAFRQTDSLGCWEDNCYAYYPVETSSGQGYGHTFYGATYCTIRNGKAAGCRHSYLHYDGCAGNLVDSCKSWDACISDYDFHGADCCDNQVANALAVGGDSYPTGDSGVIKCAFKIGNENHIVGDRYNRFTNCWSVNNTYNTSANGVQVVAQSNDNVFENVHVQNYENGMCLVDNSDDTTIITSNTIFKDCTFEDCANPSNIDGGTSATVEGVAIIRCTFTRATEALTINNASGVQILQNVWIAPNQGSGIYAINCDNVAGMDIKQNEISGSQRGFKLTSCTSTRVSQNIAHNLVNSTLLYDGGGNTGLYFNNNDVWGYTPVRYNSGTPSSGGLIQLGTTYWDDTPSNHGYIEWNANPKTVSNTSREPAAETVYLMKIVSVTGGSIGHVIVDVGQAASGSPSLSGTYVGVYDDTGTLLSGSSDLSSSFSSTGVKSLALTSSVTLSGGRSYWVSFLVATQAGTPLELAGYATTGPVNAGLSDATLNFATNGTTATTLPSSVTLSSNTAATMGFWMALAT